MATLRAYVDGSGYYVRHSFVTAGRMFHVNYQTSEAAIRRFAAQGIGDGGTIPAGLLHELIRAGELFTGGSGANSVEMESAASNESADGEINLSALSQKARHWFVLMLMCHPSVATKFPINETGDGLSLELEGLPENYLQQVLFVARRFDGTSFFENIRLSCKNLPPNTSF